MLINYIYTYKNMYYYYWYDSASKGMSTHNYNNRKLDERENGFRYQKLQI